MNRFTFPEPAEQAREKRPVACALGWLGLNLGCGRRFHSSWTNLDLQPADVSIRRWDVTQPLPFGDALFPAVYHSHLLQLLPRDQALSFLRECRRVLQPGGILRLAIPNLEAIARLYLHALDDAWHGDDEALAEHRWMVKELYDKATREPSGGDDLQDEDCDLARYRLGVDGDALPSLAHPAKVTWREWLLRWVLGKDYELLQLGRFRRGGAVHQWMYDRVSLRELLNAAGFEYFRCVGPMQSGIPNWNDFHLDTTPDGDVCKPDSLFVEAERP